MARTNLKAVSVYINDAQTKVLSQAAELENRSVSNFLLNLGLARAEELGILVYGAKDAAKGHSKPATKRKHA